MFRRARQSSSHHWPWHPPLTCPLALDPPTDTPPHPPTWRPPPGRASQPPRGHPGVLGGMPQHPPPRRHGRRKCIWQQVGALWNITQVHTGEGVWKCSWETHGRQCQSTTTIPHFIHYYPTCHTYYSSPANIVSLWRGDSGRAHRCCPGGHRHPRTGVGSRRRCVIVSSNRGARRGPGGEEAEDLD